MNKVAIIIVSLILVMLLGGCGTVSPPAPTPTPMPPVTPKATPPPVPTLSAPQLVSPHNEATAIGLTPILLWKEVSNAKGYEVTVSLNYDFSQVVHDVSTRLTAYQIREGLVPSTRYYWFVWAIFNPADPTTAIACSPVWTFTTAPPSPTPKPTPGYHTLSFTIPASGDYSFPVYLHNNQTLHLMWRVEGGQDEVWFHIITPSGKGLGFYDNEGQYANKTLAEGFCRGMTGGMTQFSPLEYGWGEGYYTMLVNGGPVTVNVEYWIED